MPRIMSHNYVIGLGDRKAIAESPARPASKPRSVCATAIVRATPSDRALQGHPGQDKVLLGYVEDKIQCVRSRSDRAAS